MRLSHLRRAARRKPTAATIISDGCRDYVIEIEHADERCILCDRRGRPLRYRSLANAKRAMRRAGVQDVSLAVRVAADEACAGPSLRDAPFASLQLSTTAGA